MCALAPIHIQKRKSFVISNRYHFIREFLEDGKVKIIFVRSKDNDADLFTKNVTGELYKTHSEKIIWKRSEVKDC